MLYPLSYSRAFTSYHRYSRPFVRIETPEYCADTTPYM
jgi:hypothetical protein